MGGKGLKRSSNPQVARSSRAGRAKKINLLKVDVESNAVIYERWCRNGGSYTSVNIVGDSIHLTLESGIIVATNQIK